MMTSKHIFSPKNLDLEDITEEYPPKIKSFSLNKLKWIVHLILSLTARSKEAKKFARSNKGFVPLSATILKNQLGNQYTKYIQYLMERKIIESNNQFIVGKTPRGYRLCKKYRKPIKVERNPFKKRISTKKFAESHKLVKEYPLLKWFGENLEINKVEADKFCDSIYDPNEKKFGEYCQRCISSEEMHLKDFHYTVDTTSKRLHTNISNLPGDLKQFVTYAGSKLVSLDVANAQPYFLSAVLNQAFYYPKGEFIIASLMNYEPNQPDTHATMQWITSGGLAATLILLKSLEQPGIQNIRQYVSLVSSGELYEKYRDEYNTVYGKEIDRGIAKMKLIKILYSQYYQYEPERHVFIQMFPFVYKVLNVLSGEYHKSKAILLQRIESFLMIEKVCKRISQERPDLPIFTIHDNIVTTEGNEDYVEQVIKSVLKEYIGYEPQVGIDPWE